MAQDPVDEPQFVSMCQDGTDLWMAHVRQVRLRNDDQIVASGQEWQKHVDGDCPPCNSHQIWVKHQKSQRDKSK